MQLSFDIEKQDDDSFAWTVSKDGKAIIFGEANSIEEALFFAMNDLYGQRELPRPKERAR